VANSADFELRLRNRITSPAEAARKSISSVRQSLIDLDKDGERAIKQLEKSIEHQAATSAKAEKANAAVATAAAKRNLENYRLIENLRRKSERDRAAEAAKAQRAVEQKAKAEVKAANEALKAQQRAEKHAAKVSSLASGKARSDAAYLAHKKVLEGGVGSEIAADLAQRGLGRVGLGEIAGATGPALAASAAIAVAATAAIGLAKAAYGAAAAVAGMAFELGKAVVEAGDFSAKSRLMLGRLAGDAREGSQAFDEIRKQAQALGLDIRASEAQAEKLIGAGLGLSQARDVIAAGADLGTGDALAEIVERIADVGELGSRDLKALQKAGIAPTNMFEQLAKATGKSKDELKKLIAAGKIGSDVAIGAVLQAAMAEVNESKPGEVAAQRVAETWEGMRNQLRSAWDNMLISMGDRLLPVLAPLAAKLSQALIRGLENPKLQAAGERLLSAIQRVGDWTVAHMPEIEAFVTKAFDGIASAIDAVTSTVEFFRTHSTETRAVLVLLSGAAAAVAGAISAVASVAALMIAPFAAASVAIVVAVDAVKSAVSSLEQLVPRFFQAGTDMISGFVNGITGGVGRAVSAVTGLAGSVANAFTGPSGIDAHSPSRLFRGYGEDSADGYVVGLRNGSRGIGSAIAEVVPFTANDNAFAARAATPTQSVPGMVAPITQAPAPGTLAPQGGESKTLNVAPGAVVVQIHTQAKDSEGVRAAAGEGVEGALKRVLGSL
jgi:tape measure domain-containing protein